MKILILLTGDDMNDNGKIKHYKLKILLPQMKLKVNCDEKIKITFFEYINIINSNVKNARKFEKVTNSSKQ